MKTTGRSNQIITHETDHNTITFKVLGVGDLLLDTSKLAEALRQRAMIHGFVQRVSDAAAIPRNTTTGGSATPEDKFAAMKSIVDHYMSGTTEWGIKRSEGGKRESMNQTTRILTALATVQGSKVETMREKVTAASEKRGITVKVYLTNAALLPKVAAELSRMAMAGTAPIAADEMLTELGV